MTGEELSQVWPPERGAARNPAMPPWKMLLTQLSKAVGSVRVHKKARALQLMETLPLGEKRFLAVVEWQGDKLLLGVTAQTITLLRPEINTTPQMIGEPGAPSR